MPGNLTFAPVSEPSTVALLLALTSAACSGGVGGPNDCEFS